MMPIATRMPTPATAHRSASMPTRGSAATTAKRQPMAISAAMSPPTASTPPIPAHRSERRRAAPKTPTTPPMMAVSVAWTSPPSDCTSTTPRTSAAPAAASAVEAEATGAVWLLIHTIAAATRRAPAPAASAANSPDSTPGVRSARTPIASAPTDRSRAEGTLSPVESSIGATTHPIAASRAPTMTSQVRGSFGTAMMLGATAIARPRSHTIRSPPGHAWPARSRRHMARVAPPSSAAATGRLTSSTVSTTPEVSDPAAATTAPASAVHRVAAPSGTRCHAAAAMCRAPVMASAKVTTSGSSSEGMIADAASPSAMAGTPMANPPSAEIEGRPGSVAPGTIGAMAAATPGGLAAGSAMRTGAPRRKPKADAYATPTRRSSQAVPAGSLTARPIVTSASATSATIAPLSAGNRTRRAGVHARARVMAAATIATTVPRTADGTGMSVKGRNSESSRDTKAGTTSPRMNDRTTAIVASTCRRSHTSATANSSSPTAGGRTYASISNVQDKPSSHSHSARLAAANAGQANSRRGAAASGTPAARVSGTRPAASVSGTGPATGDGCRGESERDDRQDGPAEVVRHQRESEGRRDERAEVGGTADDDLVGGRHRRRGGLRGRGIRHGAGCHRVLRHRAIGRRFERIDRRTGSVRTGRSERTQPDHDGGGACRGKPAPAGVGDAQALQDRDRSGCRHGGEQRGRAEPGGAQSRSDVDAGAPQRDRGEQDQQHGRTGDPGVRLAEHRGDG